MANLARKLLLLCCALSLSGAHWLLLQGAAWTSMIVARAPDTSLADALASTFSGKKPCTLCHVVQDGRAQEQKDDTGLPTFKKQDDTKCAVLASTPLPTPVCTGELHWWDSSAAPVLRTSAPLTPPPRA